MDLTADFRKIVSTYARETDKPKERPDHSPDAFLAEARKLYQQMLQVQDYLERTRRAYLSHNTSQSTNAYYTHSRKSGAQDQVEHLTEKQKDEIDYEVKKSVREASNRVKELESLEEQRRMAIEKRGSFLTRLLPDLQEKARNDLLATHRSGVIWYLNSRLIKINQRHASARTSRLAREEEKRLAAHSTTSTSTPRYALMDEESKTSSIETEMTLRETLLSSEQLQQFESENAQILEDFDNQMTQVRSVQTKLLEIAELSNELQQHLTSQTEMTDRLMTEAEQTTMDVSKGNVQLSQAKRRNKTMRLYITTIFCVLAFTLLFLDYYSS